MPKGTLANEFLDDFPATTRPGAGNHQRQTTDVDVALEALKAEGAPSRVLKFLDYNQGVDEDGNAVEVDPKTAAMRASGRVSPLKNRGYSIENGWVIVSRNGCLYAKYFGPGNVPDDYVRKSKPVGEEVAV